MKLTNAKAVGAWVVALALGMAALCGCESTDSESSAITVTPAQTQVTDRLATVSLTAASADATMELVLPLVWTVSDASLGSIKSSAGLTAVYESNGRVGNNTITVRDQNDREGIAVVNQRRLD